MSPHVQDSEVTFPTFIHKKLSLGLFLCHENIYADFSRYFCQLTREILLQKIGYICSLVEHCAMCMTKNTLNNQSNISSTA